MELPCAITFQSRFILLFYLWTRVYRCINDFVLTVASYRALECIQVVLIQLILLILLPILISSPLHGTNDLSQE